MHSARSSSPSSTNWRRPSVCSRVTPRAGQEGERPQPKCHPRKHKPPLQRAATGKPAGKRGSPTLGDQVLALATGKTQQEIAAACKGARPNHVGVVLARHKRAGRIEERDGKLYATQSAGTEQHAAL